MAGMIGWLSGGDSTATGSGSLGSGAGAGRGMNGMGVACGIVASRSATIGFAVEV